MEVEELASNHHEADPRLAMHAEYASKTSPNMPICVVSGDADVFIILLSVASKMQGDLYFRQGTSNSKDGIKCQNVISLANHLGEEI